MCGAFQKKLKTDFGKSLVRTYHTNMDARKVYFALLTHMRTSSASRIASQKLLTFITGYRIHQAKGKFTYRSATLYWTNKVAEHNEIAGTNAFTDDQIRPLFINMISTIKELNNPRSQETLTAKAAGDPNLQFSYAEYIQLAMEICDNLDETESIKNTRRKLNLHSLNDNDNLVNVFNANINEKILIPIQTNDDDDDENYISTDDTDFGVYRTTFGTPHKGPMLPRATFTQMSRDGKDAWKVHVCTRSSSHLRCIK